MSDYYLVHHGIKGQKWGVRRYQNDDGSLTDAGRARYGDSEGHGGPKEYQSTKRRERMLHQNKAKREQYVRDLEETENGLREYGSALRKQGLKTAAKEYDTEADNFKKARDIQNKVNAYRDAYEKRTSTGKLFMQNAAFLGNKYATEFYRSSRAIGESRGRSFVNAWLGQPMFNASVKKKYGNA